ncbi:hypothetical protein [Ramlibacter algicola]|uniref:DUF4124 domain-containing protein n=1 Tax=Ramlibacter algicola TaxID=2795217 RepID=A0A934PYA6_9BURK|nr:hypothetical protein [Ramlibacter algicola]MBK0391353.1 hypothetical protein [Ramlibacter algicola]
MKCILGGRVTFSDGPCEPGAQTSVVTLQEPNVADPVRQVQSTLTQTQPPPQAHSGAAAAANVSDHRDASIDRRAECAALEQAVLSIDAQARQPQSAAMQDWLASERKKHRDRQFALRC